MFRRLLDSPWFYFSVAGALVLIAVASQFRYEVPPKPLGTVDDIAALRERDDLNVVFMLIDTLRADRLSAYGYERPTSPNIDALAAKGLRFARVEAQSSWTKSSMASLWTGLYPQATGVTRYNHGLPPSALMPAEILSAAGFRTAGLIRNGWVDGNFGFAQGFDLYIKPQPSFDAERFKRRTLSTHPLKGTDYDITASAQEFLQVNYHDRFFLYMHYMDPHQYLYDAESNIFGTGYSDIYDQAIRWTDRNIGFFVESLRVLGLLDKTIIVIASDHGEGFLEHRLEGHAKSLYHEVQSVPLVISLPFDFAEPVVVDSQVGNLDLWPTLLDMLGLEALPDAHGRSLIPLIEAAGRGEPESEVDELGGRTLYSYLDRAWGRPQQDSTPYVAVVRPPYRYHQRSNNKEGPPIELFDSSRDPKELNSIAEEEPELTAEMRAQAETFLESQTSQFPDVMDVELDEMRLNQLRALGYDIGGKKAK